MIVHNEVLPVCKTIFIKIVDNYNEIMEDDIVGENKDKETEIG